MYSLKKSIKRNVNVAILLISRRQRVNQLKVRNSNKVPWLLKRHGILYFWIGCEPPWLGLALHVTNCIRTRRHAMVHSVESFHIGEICGRVPPPMCVVLGCFFSILISSSSVSGYGRNSTHFAGSLPVTRCLWLLGIMSGLEWAVTPGHLPQFCFRLCPPSSVTQSPIPQGRAPLPWTRTTSSVLTMMPVSLVFLRCLWSNIVQQYSSHCVHSDMRGGPMEEWNRWGYKINTTYLLQYKHVNAKILPIHTGPWFLPCRFLLCLQVSYLVFATGNMESAYMKVQLKSENKNSQPDRHWKWVKYYAFGLFHVNPPRNNITWP